MKFFKLSRILIHANLKVLPKIVKVSINTVILIKRKKKNTPHYQNSYKIQRIVRSKNIIDL